MDMQDNGQEMREYELSFLALNEAAGQSVTALLEERKVTIGMSVPARQMTLAYPIKKHQTALFGYTQFQTMPGTVKVIHDTLSLNKDILRFLIVTPPIKRVAERPRGPVRKENEPRIEDGQAEAPPSVKKGEALTNEALEQKLEEILQ